VLIVAGIAALVAGIAIAYTQFEGFRKFVNTVVNGIARNFEFLANAFVAVTNTIIRALNIISPFKDIPLLGQVSLPRLGEQGTQSTVAAIAARDMPSVADQVPSTVLPVLPGAGAVAQQVNKTTKRGKKTAREAMGVDRGLITLPGIEHRDFSFGNFTGSVVHQAQQPVNNVNIEVHGGDPNAVVEALRRYYRQSGPLPVAVQY